MKGIFRLLDSPKEVTTTSVAERIMANHEAYKVILILFALSIFEKHSYFQIYDTS